LPFRNLNEEQLTAARALYGRNLIIASAGTGKTSTIVARIAHLLSSGVSPNEILLLTFTNKAAAEMLARLEKYFAKDVVASIWAGTFHSVSYRWLKSIDENTVLKTPRELKTLFSACYDKYVNRVRLADEPAYSASYLFEVWERFLSSMNESFDDFIEKFAPAQKALAKIYIAIGNEFEEQKQFCGFVGFTDLLLLAKDAHIKKLLPAYKEVLVDEYQDTNNLQSALIDSIGAPSLFCVGDYDQSIYAFNGANIEIIAGFDKRYNGANVFSLSKNYRSTEPILALANKVISFNDRIYPKNLEVVRLGQAKKPKLLVYEELFLQYQDIARQISRSNREKESIAVLFRNNASADGIEASLRELGVACKRRGGTGFFDTKEVKAALDYLSWFVNSKDMLAFIHLFEYAEGIGHAVAKELFEGLSRLGHSSSMNGLLYPDDSVKSPFSPQKQAHLFDEIFELGSVARFKGLGFSDKFLGHPVLKHPKLSVEAAKFTHGFWILAQKLARVKSPASIINSMSQSYVFEYIATRLATKRATRKDHSVDENAKTEALERIKRKWKLLADIASHYNDARSFVNAMALGSNEMNEGSGVCLLSVHASKGLEFEEVYVIDLMDGRFPNRKLMGKDGTIDEERRLFYVAVTRAKDELVLSFAKYDKIKKASYIPSQFLKEAGYE
jgi:DNA helicase-2/ATP-dependent DNA helicase PcrA